MHFSTGITSCVAVASLQLQGGLADASDEECKVNSVSRNLKRHQVT